MVFIAIEGIDGVGKDSVGAALADRINDAGLLCLFTSEPTAGDHGRRVRDMLSGKEAWPADQKAFQALCILDRRDHIRKLLRPRLIENWSVVYVRYWLSTLAYGSIDNPLDEIFRLHTWLLPLEEMPLPEVCLLLDASPHIALHRLRQASRQPERFEHTDSLDAVRQAYLQIARDSRFGHIDVIDANQSFDDVLRQCLTTVFSKLDLAVRPELGADLSR